MSRRKPEPKAPTAPKKPKRYEMGYKLAPRKMRRAKYFAERVKTKLASGLMYVTSWSTSSVRRMQVEYRKVKAG